MVEVKYVNQTIKKMMRSQVKKIKRLKWFENNAGEKKSKFKKYIFIDPGEKVIVYDKSGKQKLVSREEYERKRDKYKTQKNAAEKKIKGIT